MAKNYRKETEQAIKEILHEMRNAEIKEYILKSEANIERICQIKGAVPIDEFNSISINEAIPAVKSIYRIIEKYDQMLENYLEAVKKARL